MKTIAKISYIIFGSALMLSSCSQEEAPIYRTDGSARRIAFLTSLPEVTTRATETNASRMSYLQVTAFNLNDYKLKEDGKIQEYFPDQTFGRENNSSLFTSDRLWPDPGQEEDLLHFFAYYPELPDGAELVNNTSEKENKPIMGFKIQNYSIAKDIANQVDFVTADTTGSMANNLFSGVKLNFNHQLSRIEVKAWGANKTCDIEIAGVRLGGVGVKGDFDFIPEESKSAWTERGNGELEYIFRRQNNNPDKTVTLSNKKELNNTSIAAASIMGNGSRAMVIPAVATTDTIEWDYKNDRTNKNGKLYLSVLLRVTDATGTQQYPYMNTNQGINALEIERTYLAVTNDGIISDNPGLLYKGENGEYYTNAEKTITYTAPAGNEVKEFGWASVPITGNWKPGYSYTYTLDYSHGVGLHDPSVGDADNKENYLKAGDPIISDQVGVSMSVKKWNDAVNKDVIVPGS